MSKKSLLSFALFAVPSIGIALATTHEASAGEAPKFSELTPGRITTVPLTKPPAFISPRESVPNMIVVSQKFSPEVPLMHRHITIVGDPKVAAAIKSEEGGSGGVEDTSGMCFAESHMSMLDPDMARDDRFSEWQQSFSSEANAWPKSKENPQSGVSAIHGEKVVDTNGNMTLETFDAWVDPGTRGAKLISKASLPLKLVSTAVGGVKVYVGRDERPDGKRFLQFVVTRPSDRKLQRTGSMWGVRQDGNSVHGSCAHLRVGLPTDAKGGDSASIMAPIILPSLPREDMQDDEKEKSEKGEKNAKDLPPPAPPPPPVGKGPKLRSVKRVSTPAPAGMQEKEIRIRSMQVQVSVSRTTRDKDPVVSVSFGWANRETTQRIFEAEE